jgi:hypothetical protein
VIPLVAEKFMQTQRLAANERCLPSQPHKVVFKLVGDKPWIIRSVAFAAFRYEAVLHKNQELGITVTGAISPKFSRILRQAEPVCALRAVGSSILIFPNVVSK